MTEVVFRGYTQAELEAQYDVENAVSDLAQWRARYADETRQAREQLDCRLDVPYGEHELERLDIYPAAQAGGPVQIFVHGGGWRTSSKNACGFPAPAFVARGVTFVSVDYPLSPHVPMARIVQAVRRAVAWVWEHMDAFGADPGRIHLSGHSSGGHLVAMAAAGGWAAAHGLPKDVVKGVTGISGLYDLEPHTRVAVRAYLGLDAESARANSPVHQLPDSRPKVFLATGADETAEFQRQALDYQAALARAGVAASVLTLPEHHHFSILSELSRPSGRLFRTMLHQMGVAAETPPAASPSLAGVSKTLDPLRSDPT